jgi:lipopolysaccharide/colanic/teichoic acid biosynthesis glycosyltransferase
MAKRAYDFILAGLGLLLVWPGLLLLGLLIRVFDGTPVLFRQNRVGREGRLFQIIKFRTMRPNSEPAGASVTQAGDPRVTPIGRWLRKHKLDELPQLWNVITGEMSLVGPRPEVPKYVAHYNAEQRRVLKLKPGLTDLATLLYLNEEELLRGQPDVERLYLKEVMPRKIQLNAEEIPAVNPPTVLQSIS